jgi:hypothetical protein
MSHQSDKQLSSRSRDVSFMQRSRPRNLFGQISAALLQPVFFFRTLPAMGENRQWLWVALLILVLFGYSAVRQQTLTATDTGEIPGPITPIGEVPGGDFGGFQDGGGGFDPGAIPQTPIDSAASAGNVTDDLTIAIVNASGIVLGWVIVMILLCEVSLFRGQAPRLGHNFQIAIWSSLPLALMAFLQVLYYAVGGMVGKPGISGLLSDWETFPTLAPSVQAVLISLTSQFTLFWLWGLMMLYFGARFALNGRRWTAILVVLLWVFVVVTLPVITGRIEIPETPIEDGLDPLFPDGEIPFDPSFDPSAPFDPSIPFDPSLSDDPGVMLTDEIPSDEVISPIETTAPAIERSEEAPIP